MKIVKMLPDNGAHVTLAARDHAGWTALDCAAENGDLETIKLLIEEGMDVNASNDNGVTPLKIAITKEDWSIVQELIESGAAITGNFGFPEPCFARKPFFKVNNQWDLFLKLVREKSAMLAKMNCLVLGEI